MTFNIDKMKLAVADGLSPVCASCRHYWRARDEGLPEPQCASPSPCGSPIAGLSFPHYDGPMKNALAMWCFMCGGPADLVLIVEGAWERSIGICAADVLVARGLDPVKLSLAPDTTPRSRVFVKAADATLIPLAEYGVVRRSRSSLLETMAEVDALLAEGKKL